MGEVAEMMLDGTLCSVCGTYIGTDAGYPVTCDDCKGGTRHRTVAKVAKVKPAPKGKKVQCPHCNRKAKEGKGLQDHIRVMHPEAGGK